VTAEHDALRTALGRVGAWTFTFDGRAPDRIARDVAAIERMGYRALWLPEGGESNDILANVGWALASSERLTVASGIANISAREPEVLARGAAFLNEAYARRLVLGIGVGHQYTMARRGRVWERPLDRMRTYLDVMDADGLANAAPRILAALGDGMLRLAATRALGAHSYFVPVEHTAHAREVLGPEPLLAVEVGVMPGADEPTARSWGHSWAAEYLELPNYANNWRRLGFTDDEVAGSGSDRLLEAAFAWGSVETIAARVREHLDAGADHVCVQVIGAPDGDAETDLRRLEELAPAVITDRAQPPPAGRLGSTAHAS
jgi:probable F420-dependent oxidoreductase